MLEQVSEELCNGRLFKYFSELSPEETSSGFVGHTCLLFWHKSVPPVCLTGTTPRQQVESENTKSKNQIVFFIRLFYSKYYEGKPNCNKLWDPA